MTLTLMILMVTTISFTALMAMNPLSMGLLILLLALVISITFALSMSSWVALLIFLIYIGGMLVMLSYFVAITPNQNISMTALLTVAISSSVTLMFIMLMTDMIPPINTTYVTQTNIMYEKFNIFTLIMLALILLYTMVVVVKISVHNKGPLRPFSSYV